MGWNHQPGRGLYIYPFYKDSPLKGGMIIPNTKTLDPRTDELVKLQILP